MSDFKFCCTISTRGSFKCDADSYNFYITPPPIKKNSFIAASPRIKTILKTSPFTFYKRRQPLSAPRGSEEAVYACEILHVAFRHTFIEKPAHHQQMANIAPKHHR